MIELIYTSRSTLARDVRDREVEGIVAAARRRNLQLRVTGALLFDGARFAQLLEGEEAAVDELMASIARDPRHDQVQVASRRGVDTRSFATWSMAYSGPTPSAARMIAEVAQAPEQRPGTALMELVRTMQNGASGILTL